jgi:putative transposase
MDSGVLLFQTLFRQLYHLLHARLREKDKRPTAGCLDSQSVKCTAVFLGSAASMPGKGSMAANTIFWWIPWAGSWPSGSRQPAIQDRDGARRLLSQMPGGCKKLRKIGVDGGYSGRLLEWVAGRFKFSLAGVLRPQQTKQFVLLLRRWVVERTFKVVEPFTPSQQKL